MVPHGRTRSDDLLLVPKLSLGTHFPAKLRFAFPRRRATTLAVEVEVAKCSFAIKRVKGLSLKFLVEKHLASGEIVHSAHNGQLAFVHQPANDRTPFANLPHGVFHVELSHRLHECCVLAAAFGGFD